jgi:sortase A
MLKFQIFLMFAGSLLAGLGLTISLGVAVKTISEPQPTVSPLDQTDDIIEPEGGFAPLLIPTAQPNLASPSPSPTSPGLPASILSLAVTPASNWTPDPLLVPASDASLTPTSEPIWTPDRLLIPSIHLDAPVIPAKPRIIEYEGKMYPQWRAPNSFAVGWSPASASLGVTGNTVLFGHHNIHGEVFVHLVDVEVNDVIVLYSGERKFAYVVALKMILQERHKPLYVRLENARWILPSLDERLTLVTCWPYTSNTHRLIIVAVPISADTLKNFPRTSNPTPTGP